MRNRRARWTRALGGPGAPPERAPESMDAPDVDLTELDPAALERRVFGDASRTDDASRAPKGDPPLSV